MRGLFTLDRLSIIVRLRGHVQHITAPIAQVRVNYPIVIDVLDGLIIHFVVVVVSTLQQMLIFFFYGV